MNPESSAPGGDADALEAVKLDLEIRELRGSVLRSWMSIFVALATPLAIAGLGYFISQAAQGVENQRHDADIYARLVQDLGSGNAPARAGAVVGLVKFARSDPARSAQTTILLVTQLTMESDSRVLRVMVPSIASIGEAALPEVILENRSASLLWTRSIRRYMMLSMPTLEAFVSIPLRERLDDFVATADNRYAALAEPLSGYLDDGLLDDTEQEALQALDGVGITSLGEGALSDAQNKLLHELRLLAEGSDRTFGALDTRFSEIPRRLSAFQRAGRERERTKRATDALHAARSIFVTSVVLERLLRSVTPRTDMDLRNIVLMSATFDGRSFSGTNFAGAFLAGSARGANLSGADLSASRVLLNLEDADLSYASVDGAVLPDVAYANGWHETYLRSANLTGISWWDAQNVKAPDAVAVGFESDGRRCLYYARSITQLTTLQNGRSAVDRASTHRWFIALVPTAQASAAGLTKRRFEQAFPRKINELKRNRWLARSRSGTLTGGYSYDTYFPVCSS
jgi:uncharacterized protein YjbI with pentapeptide repeats